MAYLRSTLPVALIVSTLLWSANALAQLVPGVPEAPAEQSAQVQENARVLAEILQDEQARQALIDQLLQVAEGRDGTGPGEAVAADEDVTIARQVARYTREAAESFDEVSDEFIGWMARLWASLTTSGGRFERLGEATLSLLVVIAATVALFHVLGFVANRLFDWLARRARDASWLRVAILLAASSLIDALVILIAWASGYVLALYGLDPYGQMDTSQSLYLNAFLLIESSKVVLRFFLAPRYRRPAAGPAARPVGQLLVFLAQPDHRPARLRHPAGGADPRTSTCRVSIALGDRSTCHRR